ncbi:hypothetical protein [Halodesulfovibrio aestuarii]|uniref:hypothetical protein n=1 Tax=Halodesulfovibrio aestuarii TaxID=126333 RepID=UPI003D3486BD
MRDNGNFLPEIIEDARARIFYLDNASSEEVREWKLNRAFQILSADRAKETCPKDVHGWIPKKDPIRCKRCSESHHVRAVTPMQCWQEWAFGEVENYISRSQKLALQGIEWEDASD